jgi:hypothetical protein
MHKKTKIIQFIQNSRSYTNCHKSIKFVYIYFIPKLCLLVTSNKELTLSELTIETFKGSPARNEKKPLYF